MSMKKFFMMLVLTVVCVAMTAQNLYSPIRGFRDAGQTAILADGTWVDITSYEGWNHYETNYSIAENWNIQRQKLAKDNPQLAARVYGYGGLMGTNVMMNGVMMGGNGMMMMTGNGQNTAFVGGNLGMATGNSNIYVDNNNAGEMLGTGVNFSYDTASNSLSVGGDAGGLLRLGRGVMNLFKGSGNKGGFKNGQILQDTNGNQYLVQNGQLIPLQQQVTRTAQPVQQQVVTRSAQQPQTTTRTQQQVRSNTTVQQNQGTQYEIVFDSASGTYVKVPVR